VTTPPPQFSRPGSSESFSPSKHDDWIGKLFLIRPNYSETITFDPADGPKEMVNCFVVILDLQGPPDGRPVVIDGASIGGAGLRPQIKNKVGQLVLGRLQKMPPQPGKSATYRLDPNFTPDDESRAAHWISTYGPIPPVPDPPAPAAPQQQWGAQPAAAEPLPYDQWQNTPGAQAAPAQGQQAPSAWAPPAAQAPPQQWQAPQGQAPAQQAPAQQWAPQAAAQPQPAQQWQPQAPAAAQAPPQQWAAQAPAGPPATPMGGYQPGPPTVPAPHQDPALVARLQQNNIAVTADMSMEQLQMIAASFPQ